MQKTQKNARPCKINTFQLHIKAKIYKQRLDWLNISFSWGLKYRLEVLVSKYCLTVSFTQRRWIWPFQKRVWNFQCFQRNSFLARSASDCLWLSTQENLHSGMPHDNRQLRSTLQTRFFACHTCNIYKEKIILNTVLKDKPMTINI